MKNIIQNKLLKPISGLRSTIYAAGFTMIELLVVITITAMLTTIMVVNFQALRRSQEIRAAQQDVLSKIREVQSNLLAGKNVAGTNTAATAYEVVFTPASTSYVIDYYIESTRSTLETVATLRNTQVQQVLVGGTPVAQTRLRFEAPSGKITADGAANQIVQIVLVHASGAPTRTIVIDGISGRVGAQ